jgi:hypothetical protein
MQNDQPQTTEGDLVPPKNTRTVDVEFNFRGRRPAMTIDNPQTAGIERDAARYRWLRKHQDCIPDLTACEPHIQALTLDAFIDAEIKRDAEYAR